MARTTKTSSRASSGPELSLDEYAQSEATQPEHPRPMPDSEPIPPEAGAFDRLARLTQTAPLLSNLGGLSPTYAIRWLLWLFAVLGSLSGICLVMAGTVAGLLMLGPLSSSAQAVLSDASSASLAAAGGIDAAAPLTSVVANVTNSTANSLVNVSEGLNSMSTSLDSLSSIAGINTGLGTSAASMRAAASNLAPAIASLQGAGQSSSDLSLRLSEAGDSLRKSSEDLSALRQSVGMSIFYAQVMVVMFGLGLSILLSGVLMLALAYGPPKKN